MQYRTPEFKLSKEQQEVFSTLKIPATLTSVAVLYKAFPEPMGEILESTLDSDDWGSYYNDSLRRFTMDLFDQGMIPVDVAYAELNCPQKLSRMLATLFREPYVEYRKLVLDQLAKVLVENHSRQHQGKAKGAEGRMDGKIDWLARRNVLTILDSAPIGDLIFRIEGVESYANIALVLLYQSKQSELGKPYAKVSLVQPVSLKARKVIGALSTLLSRSNIGYTEPKIITDYESFVLSALSGDIGINHDLCTLKLLTPEALDFWFNHKPLVVLRDMFLQ